MIGGGVIILISGSSGTAGPLPFDFAASFFYAAISSSVGGVKSSYGSP